IETGVNSLNDRMDSSRRLRVQHPVYIVAERVLTRRRDCLEKVCAVAEEVLEAKRALELTVANTEDEVAAVETAEIPDAVEKTAVLKPKWLTREMIEERKKQRLSGGYGGAVGAAGGVRIRYSEIGDATVRSSWIGSS
ncbi:uncharacterized protein TM35_000261300, partial [Trypanosoma theileri]